MLRPLRVLSYPVIRPLNAATNCPANTTLLVLANNRPLSVLSLPVRLDSNVVRPLRVVRRAVTTLSLSVVPTP